MRFYPNGVYQKAGLSGIADVGGWGMSIGRMNDVAFVRLGLDVIKMTCRLNSVFHLMRLTPLFQIGSCD